MQCLFHAIFEELKLFQFLSSVQTLKDSDTYNFADLTEFPGQKAKQTISDTWKFKPTEKSTNVIYRSSSPFTFKYSVETLDNCWDSLGNGKALKAVKSCDQTVNLLLGPWTAIGTLQAIVGKVSEKRDEGVAAYANYMPGECCVSCFTNKTCTNLQALKSSFSPF